MFSKDRFFKGNERTILLKKNILGSLFVKVWSSIVQLLLIPITLNCLNQYEYGIWLTINSVLIWVDQFDIGLGNGLRNKLAESLANGEKERGREQVSTTFVMLCMVIMPILIISAILIYNLNVYSWFNVNRDLVPNLNNILFVSIVLVGFTFIFKFIGNIYLALQLPAINNAIQVSGQTIAFVIVFILSFFNTSLMAVAIAYTIAPLIIYIIAYPITFRKYSYLKPSLKLFRKKELSSLLSLGLSFFITQLAGLAIFASSNFIISNVLTPSEVTPYQISYRYFSLSIMLFTLISAPLWSATTDAYTKKDMQWIMNMMNKMRLVMLGFLIIIILMLFVSPFVYKLWIGKDVGITWNLSVLCAAYIMLLIYSTCYSNILFGIGKIRMITIITVLEAIIYIPLAIFLGREYGVTGIVCALILVNFMCAITNRIQYSMIIAGKAIGIWDK